MTRPAVFLDLAFEAALAAARAAGKLLLLDATAAWCGPCTTMDRTTWADAGVARALAGRAVAIQIDVDAEEALARQLRIRAMPTVIAFRDGEELDRVVGLKRPAELLAWLGGLDRGETALDRQRRAVEAAPEDMLARMTHARMLVEAQELEEATRVYLWLWAHVLEHDPAMAGVRHSFLLSELEQLAAEHPPARAELEGLRDALAPEAGGAPDPERLADWFALNQVLGEKARGVTWLDQARPTLEIGGRLAWVLERWVVPMLIEGGRLADAGALLADPLATLRWAEENRRRVEEDEGMREDLAAHLRARFMMQGPS